MGKLGENKIIKKAVLFSDEEPDKIEINEKSGTFINLPVDLLLPNPYQPREVWDEESLKNLSGSIKKNGIIHSLCVFKDKGQYYVAAGERRLRASKLAGLTKVPCIITNGNPAEIALLENLQREDLRPIEEALAYETMQKEFGYTQQEIADIVGKSRTSITDTLLLLKLDDEIKTQCQRVDIYKPKRELIKIARIKDPEDQKRAFYKIPKKKKYTNKISLKEIVKRLGKVTTILDQYIQESQHEKHKDKNQYTMFDEPWDEAEIQKCPIFWASVETSKIIRRIRGEITEK